MPPLSPDDMPAREPIVIRLRKSRGGYAAYFEGRRVTFPKYDANSFVQEIVNAIVWETEPRETRLDGDKNLVQRVFSSLRPTWWL